MNKLALGSAQFGLDYGITNQRGKIPFSEVSDIVKKAIEIKCCFIDTASVYGESEQLLGSLMFGEKMRVITKISPNKDDSVKKKLKQSAYNLKRKNIDTVLLHNFNLWKNNNDIWSEMESCKEIGMVSKIGLSIYSPNEWDEFFNWYDKKNKKPPDVLQFPLSVFDQRFLPSLSEIKNLGIEIHIRSIFLQGLAFLNPKQVPKYFQEINKNIEELELLEKKLNLSRLSLLLLFPYLINEVDAFIVGIDSFDRFKEIILANEKIYDIAKTKDVSLFEKCEINNENMILPFLWKK